MIATSVSLVILDHSCSLHSFALAVYYVEDRHYSTSCAQHFTAVANSWGIYDKITTLATDNARNVTAAVTMLPFEHMPCAAHSLLLSVRKALEESGIEDVKSTQNCWPFQAIALQMMWSFTPNKTKSTRNLSLWYKMSPLVGIPLCKWSSDLQEIKQHSAVFDNPHHKHNLFLLNESEWEKLRIMETLLEPCRYATDLLGGERYIS